MASSRGKSPSQRQLRVGEEVRHALVEILSRGHFRDPVLRATPITVTEVRLTPDLRRAIVFVIPLGGEGMTGVIDALQHAAAYLRSQLARQSKLRFMPQLVFQPDVTYEEVDRIEALLQPKPVPGASDSPDGDRDEDDGA